MGKALPLLEKILGPQDLIKDPEEARSLGSDWTRLPAQPLAAAFPRTTLAVSQVLSLCQKEGIAVVPSGGRTGLSGGAVAAAGELILSTSRLNQLGPVDPVGRTVRAGAGVTTQALHEHAEKHGLTWPVDLAAKGSSTIGGNLATNAGGIRVVRYGMARRWVTGLQAVTMNGDILDLNHGLEKNNAGYDLLQLLVGSEGTLAIITEATLKLVRLPKDRVTALLGAGTLEALRSLFLSLRQEPLEILAFEFFSSRCGQAVEKRMGVPTPLARSFPYYALVEVELTAPSDRERVEAWLAELLEKGLAGDGRVAQTSQESRSLWQHREGITESIAGLGAVRKYDVSVPVARVAEFLREVEKETDSTEYPFDLMLFGHLGDGSPHLNLLCKPGVSPAVFEQGWKAFENGLYPRLRSYGGSVSAEHGIGMLKKNWLTFSRTEAEMKLFQGIKKTFDPQGLLNPGKVL